MRIKQIVLTLGTLIVAPALLLALIVVDLVRLPWAVRRARQSNERLSWSHAFGGST